MRRVRGRRRQQTRHVIRLLPHARLVPAVFIFVASANLTAHHAENANANAPERLSLLTLNFYVVLTHAKAI